MFAVIKTGGRQYRVVPDDVLEIGKIAGDVGTIVQLGEVLVVGGDTPVLGMPTVAGATVAAEVLRPQARPEGHRLQEAPPQEFAPQARLSRRDHGAPHHRDPDRQRQAHHRPAAEEVRGARRPKATRKPKAAKKKAPAKKAAAKPAAKKAPPRRPARRAKKVRSTK